MSTEEQIRDWFLQCELVNQILSFNVDYLGADPIECAVYSSPSMLNYVEDIMGNIRYAKRQSKNFTFATKFPFGDDAFSNMSNLNFFENVQAWMYEQNKQKNFPQIEEGEVVSIMPVNTAYLTTAEATSAIYQLDCTIQYEMSDID